MKNLQSFDEFILINEASNKQIETLLSSGVRLTHVEFNDVKGLSRDLWVPSVNAADSTTNVKLEAWFEKWLNEFIHAFGDEGSLKINQADSGSGNYKFNVVGNKKYDTFYEKYMKSKGSWMSKQNGYKGD